uniref:Disease resistance N-terminal domain-containing protein n=1 Tax=Fagus sylvatica TaxID=28930 RepID=A0A2N9F9V8_FAGSY
MAEAILYGVAQTIIERLGSSTFQEIGSIWGIKDEFYKMTNTVSTIQAVLHDAEDQQVNNRQVKDWLMKLRDAVFDADDLLSEFSTHILRQRVMGGHKMPKKVCIFDNGDVGTTSTYQQHISLPSFTRLYELGISYCSKLTCMPLFPTLVELSLNDASLKPLQQTMAMTMNTAGASSLPFSSPPLSKLKNLYLSIVQGVESLPKEWLQNLPSLEKLDISELPTLTFINRTMQRLISHKKLKISDWEEVDLFSDDDDGSESQRPMCLQSLIFQNISTLRVSPCLSSTR